MVSSSWLTAKAWANISAAQPLKSAGGTVRSGAKAAQNWLRGMFAGLIGCHYQNHLMRTLILSCHSTVNEPLARVTAMNRWNYSARHGYDLLTVRMEWAQAKLGFLLRLRELLDSYGQVLTIGSDVLFMNYRVKIEDIAGAGDNVVLAKEYLGEVTTLNNDVMIWRRTMPTVLLLDHLIENEPNWREQPLLWQIYLQKLIETDPGLAQVVRLVEPAVMNSSPRGGPGGKNRWQMGDWICHLVCGDNSEKFQQALQFLALADSG